MKSIFSSNLKAFLEENKISQSTFAKNLSVSNASISNYLSGISEPTLSFLLKFKSTYNINLDEFLTKPINLNKEQTFQQGNFSRFVGNYLVYFYDGSSYIGRASNYQKNILKYGVVCISQSGNNLTTYAAFFKELSTALSLKEKLDCISGSFGIIDTFSKFTDMIYQGNTELSSTQIFIFLKSYNDQLLMIFNNPPSNKQYIGGLGTSNSVSRGREHMPCVQYIILSRKKLNLPEGEIYNLLSLDVPDVNLHNETEKLIELFKNLYLESPERPVMLEEYQKKKIIEDSLERAVADCIEANLFRFAKVSAREDDYYYNLIKDEGEE